MLRAKDLRGQVDKPVAPRLRPNTQTVCFVAPFPPVTRVLANISSPPHGADIDNAGLLYCPSPVAAPPCCSPATDPHSLPLSRRRILQNFTMIYFTMIYEGRTGIVTIHN